MKKISIICIILILVEILFTNFYKNYSADLNDYKCFNTNKASSIELIFESSEIVPQKDMILYIKCNKSIKGREIQVKEQENIRNDGREVAFVDNDGNYYYQYTYLTYKDSKINTITITKLPNEDITLYAWVKYNGKEYHVINAKNKDSNSDLTESSDKTLIPKENKLSKSEITKLKAEDTEIMKKKWADALSIDVNDVDKYLDLYNAKGQGKLHKDGKYVKNEKNEIVSINGVGLFHLLDYGYMYNEDTLKALKYWGVNCIRIPAYLDYRVSSSTSYTITPSERGLKTAFDEHMEEMDRIIDIATKEGLYCMVDFHILGENGDINQYYDMAEKFFTHFGTKYGNQNNIIWELANEPYGTTVESLAKYVKKIEEVVKKYDNNPVMISGWTMKNNVNENGKLSECYKYFKEQGINDVFISYHYYGGEDIVWPKKLYDTTDIPLSYTEWSNYDSDLDPDNGKNYTEMTKKYMNWWNEEGMINCAWMLCHGNWKYILWNKDLGDKSEALKYGCISEEYLSDYGKLVFGNYFDNNIKRVKNNSVYINRNEKQEDDEKKEDNNNGNSKEDNTTEDDNKKDNKSEISNKGENQNQVVQNNVNTIKAENFDDDTNNNTKLAKILPKTGEKQNLIKIGILVGIFITGICCIIFKIKLSKIDD